MAKLLLSQLKYRIKQCNLRLSLRLSPRLQHLAVRLFTPTPQDPRSPHHQSHIISQIRSPSQSIKRSISRRLSWSRPHMAPCTWQLRPHSSSNPYRLPSSSAQSLPNTRWCISRRHSISSSSRCTPWLPLAMASRYWSHSSNSSNPSSLSRATTNLSSSSSSTRKSSTPKLIRVATRMTIIRRTQLLHLLGMSMWWCTTRRMASTWRCISHSGISTWTTATYLLAGVGVRPTSSSRWAGMTWKIHTRTFTRCRPSLARGSWWCSDIKMLSSRYLNLRVAISIIIVINRERYAPPAIRRRVLKINNLTATTMGISIRTGNRLIR